MLLYLYSQMGTFPIDKINCVSEVNSTRSEVASLTICANLCLSSATCMAVTYRQQYEQCLSSDSVAVSPCGGLDEGDGTIAALFYQRKFWIEIVLFSCFQVIDWYVSSKFKSDNIICVFTMILIDSEFVLLLTAHCHLYAVYSLLIYITVYL